MEKRNYFSGVGHALKSLTIGLKTSIKVFFEHDETEQYPENRKTLHFSDRNRFCLEMIHNERNEHHCVACGLCQMACPNGSIHVYSEMVETPDGKKMRQLVKYEYNLGQCMFCNLCVRACPHDAIRFNQDFENAVFDKSKLIMQLNHPGSHLEEKPKPAPAPRPAAPAQPAAQSAAAPAKPAVAPAKPVAQATEAKADAAQPKAASTASPAQAVKPAAETPSVKPASEAASPASEDINKES